MLRRGVHIVVTAAGALVIVRLWNLDLAGLAARGAGARVAGALVDIGLTLMLAYLVWQLAKTAIDQRLEREARPQGVSDPGEAGGTGGSRLRTLLPLARGTVFAVVCVMSVLSMLAALGVNIGPLLAGAGVVGLAVGFGAQTLVRDIISGAFYLVDDAFRLGEYIDVGDAKGTVEKIGIRSMQLRHHRGAVNVVPYGSIRRMINSSRDWVVEKLEFRLTYDTDITKVKKIIKRIGQELAADPDWGPTSSSRSSRRASSRWRTAPCSSRRSSPPSRASSSSSGARPTSGSSRRSTRPASTSPTGRSRCSCRPGRLLPRPRAPRPRPSRAEPPPGTAP